MLKLLEMLRTEELQAVGSLSGINVFLSPAELRSPSFIQVAGDVLVLQVEVELLGSAAACSSTRQVHLYR